MLQAIDRIADAPAELLGQLRGCSPLPRWAAIRHDDKFAGAARLRGTLMHDTPHHSHWHEPKAGENAGLGKFLRAAMPYDRARASDRIGTRLLLIRR